jgi:hypothetical protein
VIGSQRHPKTRAKVMLGLVAVLADPAFPAATQAAIAVAGGTGGKEIQLVFASTTQTFEALVEFVEDSTASIAQQVTERTPPGALRQGRIAAGLCQFFTKNPSCASLMLGAAVRGEKQRFYERIAAFWAGLPALTGDVYADLVAGRMAIYVASGFKRRPDERLDDVLTQLEEQLW